MLTFTFLISSFAQAATPNCVTADGMKFSAIQESPQEALCDTDYLIIDGVTIRGKAGNECSELVSFDSGTGTKLSITSNGLGTLLYKGKLQSVNCEGR